MHLPRVWTYRVKGGHTMSKTVVFDFDGVIHSYIKKETQIYD